MSFIITRLSCLAIYRDLNQVQLIPHFEWEINHKTDKCCKTNFRRGLFNQLILNHISMVFCVFTMNCYLFAELMLNKQKKYYRGGCLGLSALSMHLLTAERKKPQVTVNQPEVSSLCLNNIKVASYMP
ncbi:hypothetical protein CTZ24_23610 (plasmid) [Pantoea phytobeneficialis]|uniref:Uncharacterized protein n=1 Tax=Pantoea phytobeneficialis TaxID=2052056 RepID=A0AAP9KRV8_9GAMM|nr:hypothetical protein CTZ24_23610 [Pantoea phytobeneficialis]